MVKKFLIIIFFLFAVAFFPQHVFADTTPYRSAGWVGIPSSGTPYTNLTGCQVTDGIYCERPLAAGGTNLYVSSFGTLTDFGIPQGSTVTAIHFRVTGKGTPIIHWIQVGQGRNKPVSQLCQNPNDFDSYRIYMTTTDAVHDVYTVFTPYSTGGNNLDQCFSANNIDTQNFTLALFYNGYSVSQWYADVDNFEIAFDYTPAPTPTPTPTATPTPTPTPLPTPAPFLDLPWKYEGSFEDQAFNPGSWFDHQYPLQNIDCCQLDVLPYDGVPIHEYYRSHSGYDYNGKNGVFLNTPVLAAAAGSAEFEPASKSAGGGIVIKIDHGNHYQTWYEHLSKDDLIVNTEGTKVYVQQGQKIGKVGMTGNTNGPHIHLSVFKDINENNSFKDDYQYGLTDPLGWDGEYTDPWTEIGGAKSYKLFLRQAKPKEVSIPPSGGAITTDDGKLQANIPNGAYPTEFSLKQFYGPFESFVSNGKSYISAAPSFFLEAKDSLGDSVTQFYLPIQIIYHYSVFDSLNVKENTLLLHYFNEQTQTWDPLPSVVDTVNKTVTAVTSHFSHFALIGEIRDDMVPTTLLSVTGDKGQENWYRSSVTVALDGKDNADGVGLQYTLYSLDGDNWDVYTEPLVFDQEGKYNIFYQSFDKAGNAEERKTISFHIDKTLPEAKIQFDTQAQDINIVGTDNSGPTTISQVSTGSNTEQVTVTDQAGNTLILNDIDRQHGQNAVLSVNSAAYNGTIVNTDTNKLSIKYHLDKSYDIKKFDQIFEQKGVVKVELSYDPQANNTTITQNGISTTVDGTKILQLSTNQGTLEYSY